jgi:hypothetical protein
MHMKQVSSSQVVLPAVSVIGFTGHRNLSDEEAARSQVLQFLKEKKRNFSGIVCGISSCAAGGDLLFAETCIQLGLPLRILLPMPKEQFRADFDAEQWKRVESILLHAMSTDVTGEETTREARYYDCGIETVQQCSELLTLWNGQPSQGLGGTEQIVNFAKAKGRPVTWIHSQTGAIQEFNKDKVMRTDPELGFLNALPDSNPESNVRGPKDLVTAWFAKIDASANHTSPKVRLMAAIPILCTSAAVLFSFVGSMPGRSHVWRVIDVILALTAGALPILMKLQREQVLWARIRTAAEISRSYLAFWNTPSTYDVLGPEVVPELAEMLVSLNYLKASDNSSRRSSIEDFKEEYRRDRVQLQMEYFSRYAALSKKKAKQYEIGMKIAIGLGMTVELWDLVYGTWWKGLAPEVWEAVLSHSGSVFFQIATVIGALLAVNDYKRRRQRYVEMEHLLREWDKQLEFAQTWPVLLQIARKIERALLSEVIEWRSLIRHRKLVHE